MLTIGGLLTASLFQLSEDQHDINGEFMALIDTTCPRCNATHARKLSLIHAEGISTLQSSMQSVGQANTIGRVKITSTGTATGVQQSAASKGAAPPEIPELVSDGTRTRNYALYGGVILTIFCGFIAIVSDASLLSTLAVVFGVICLSYGATTFINTEPSASELSEWRERTATERRMHEDWEKTFACGSCGHRFIPTSLENL
jgi:hypothetical protein